MTQHVMVDLETFGTDPNAMIVAIGAVKFDPNDVKLDDRFYTVVDPASCEQYGLKADMATIKWWMNNKRDEARRRILTDDAIDLFYALDGFAKWFGPESLPVWGNGATFDNVILASAFKHVGMDRPWSYRHDMCFRTIRALAPIKLNTLSDRVLATHADGRSWHYIDISTKFLKHDALSDAMVQAFGLQVSLDALGIKL
jgi:DNA polymerase III epsilon subunit-like protein